MAKKNNIRSIRFSDEMMEMIESQCGDTFTAKFEALITRCMWELPEKERQLKRIQKDIDREWERYKKIQKKASELENSVTNMGYMMEQYNRTAKAALKRMEEYIKVP